MVFNIFLPRKLLWPSTCVMTEKFTHVYNSVISWNSCWPSSGALGASLLFAHRGGVFSRNPVQQQNRRAQSHQSVPLLLAVMATSLETNATASIESQKCWVLPGPALGHKSAGANGRAASAHLGSPRQQTVLPSCRPSLYGDEQGWKTLWSIHLDINSGSEISGLL